MLTKRYELRAQTGRTTSFELIQSVNDKCLVTMCLHAVKYYTELILGAIVWLIAAVVEHTVSPGLKSVISWYFAVNTVILSSFYMN